jgi:YHS domain-containing protein
MKTILAPAYTFAVYLLLLLCYSTAIAQVDPVDKNGLAIGGYDLVAYFTSSKAVKGNPEIVSELNGARYYFASQENKNEFDRSPKQYLPQYEGYCALAVGTTGKKISIDPKTFKVTDGKLYLFFNGKSFSGTTFNSLEPWLKDEGKLISKCDQMWPKVKERKYKHEN